MRDLKIILGTILISLFFIVCITLYKVQKQHEDRVVLVTEKRITEAALNCVWDDVCTSQFITLGELISLGYAKDEVNPITKMYYSHDSYVEITNEGYTFHEV